MGEQERTAPEKASSEKSAPEKKASKGAAPSASGTATLLGMQAAGGNRAAASFADENPDVIRRWFGSKKPKPPPVISGPLGVAPSKATESGISAPTNVHMRQGKGPVKKADFGTENPDLGGALNKDQQRELLEHDQDPSKAKQAGPQNAFPNAAEVEQNEKLFAAPTASAIQIPGLDIEDANPAAAIKLYEAEAGRLLKEGQRHDVKIERYRRYVGADYEFTHKQVQELAKVQNNPKKSAAIKAKFNNRDPAENLPAARERIRLAQAAKDAADREIPLLDGTYEEARRIKTDVLKETGGKKGAALKGESRGEVSRIRGMVQQAKLGEGLLFVKTKELKADKAEIRKAGRGTYFEKHYGMTIGATALSTGLSMVTLGMAGVSPEKTEGGYTSEMKIEPIWVRWEKERTRILNLLDKQPYGKATTLHAVIQLFSYITKEVRNIFGSISLLSAALSLIPPIAPIFAPVSAFCGLVALGLTAMKAVADIVLASWSTIARLTNSNARNDDLLTSQATTQGIELFNDAMSLGVSAAATSAGNLHAKPGSQYLTMEQQAQNPFTVGGVGAGMGATAAKAGTTVGGLALAGHATGVAQMEATSKGAFLTDLSLKFQDGQSRPKTRKGPGPQKQNEPEWIENARKETMGVEKNALQSLVTMHAAKLRRFNTQTQALMEANKPGPGATKKLKAKLATEKPKSEVDAAGTVDKVGGAAEGLAELLPKLSSLTEECATPAVLAGAGAET